MIVNVKLNCGGKETKTLFTQYFCFITDIEADDMIYIYWVVKLLII